MSPLLLEVEDLSVAYGTVPALRDVSFAVERGEAYGLVGESGSGKSTLAMALVRYLASGGHVTGGRIRFDGEDVRAMDEVRLRAFRGHRAAVVYQNPAAALDPSMRVGEQVAEALQSGQRDREQVIELFQRVRLADPRSVYERFPHQLSGGMQQRVVIAMALAGRPDLLLLDEPTTGLDATVEAAILELIATLRRELAVTVVLISHNLSVVARVCDRVGVLYAGRLVEEGPVGQVFDVPAHPYTRGLLASLPGADSRKDVRPLHAIPGTPLSAATQLQGCLFAPRCTFARAECSAAEPALYALGNERSSRCYFADEVLATPVTPTIDEVHGYAVVDRDEPLLDVSDAHKTFSVANGKVKAVDGVSLRIRPGMTVGLVGESGSGKSTLARIIAGLEHVDSGALEWRGKVLPKAVQRRSRGILRELQMVFQDPDSTLNPRHTIGTLLDRSIRRLTNLNGAARRKRVQELLDAVDMDARYLTARPSELSGGQRQRVAIARAFAGSPALVLCDEPTSALDASVQATILNLLARLQSEQGSAYLFISHDIGVVRYLADVVGVLYAGRLMQLGPAASVFGGGPRHPYTQVLLTASALERAPAPSGGCPFQASCPRKLGSICETEAPPWRETTDAGGILCHIPLEELE